MPLKLHTIADAAEAAHDWGIFFSLLETVREVLFDFHIIPTHFINH
jgi:hypothetical protein